MLETHETAAGMPTIEADAPPVSAFEFWPAWLFYAPVWFWTLGLMARHRGIRLPLMANPGWLCGGLVGESKTDLFARFTGQERARLPDYIVVDRTELPVEGQVAACMTQLGEQGLAFPLVAKPDIGCRGAGVRPIRSVDDLSAYVVDFPAGARFLLQRMVEAEGEAGVFYVRAPGVEHGEILSLTLKYFPHVVGDGRATLRQLILADRRAGRVPHLYLDRHRKRLDQVLAPGEAVSLVFSGSHSKGAIFRDGNAYVTEALRARFDAIADGLDGFHFGRFDVRFADFQSFLEGDDFAIIEFNGAGAESTHIWDSRTSLFSAWRALFRQFSLLYRIGAANRKKGVRPERWRDFLSLWLEERRLVRRYPSTE